MSRLNSPASDPTGFLLDGRWRIRPDINRVYDGEIEHQVPDKFMQVLVFIARHPGVVSRQELFDAVWPDTIVVDESLTRAISSLRKLFDDDPKHPRIIETIPKKGYRLVARIEPVVTESAPSVGRSSQPSKSGSRRMTVSILAAVAVLVVSVLWWTATRPGSRSNEQTTQIQVTALPGVEEYPSLSPAGDRLAFVWDGGDKEPDGIFVQVIGAGPALRLTHIPAHYAFPTWTHDSRHIAYVRLTGPARGIFMVPAAGGAETEVVAAESDVTFLAPAYSPDGRWLVFSRRDAPGEPWKLHRKDLETGDITCLAPSPTVAHGGYRARFSPDGRQLAYLRIGVDRRDLVLTTIDGSPTRQIDTVGRSVADFAWTSKGDGFVVSEGGSLSLVNLDGSTRRVLSTTIDIGALSIAAQAPVLAFSVGRREKNIWQWSPPSDQDGGSTRLIHSTAWDAYPAISPDGEAIAFLSDRTGTTQLWLASRDGADVRQLTDLDRLTWQPPVWSPDGERVAVTADADGTAGIAIVEVAGGRLRLLPPLDGAETQPNWSADETTLYVSRTIDGNSAIWRRPISPESTDGAEPITSNGGHRAVEAPNGADLFYTREQRSKEGIWRCGPGGRDPELVFTLTGGELLTWQATTRGLTIGTQEQIGDREYRVSFFDFETEETTDVITIPGRLGFHLDVDPKDDRLIVYDQTEAIDSDIFAMKNY